MKQYIRITKQFQFEMAHALVGYDGPCKNIHGHSYELDVTIKGTPIEDTANSKLGMVMDFGDLKRIVKSEIVDIFDHALVLSSQMDPEVVGKLKSHYEKIIVVDYQPTSELFLIDFAKKIKALLPDYVQLHSIKLRETGNSFAEWHQSDQ